MLEVKPISNEETKPFILLIHYARRMPSISYAFGLFEDNKLIGVCAFGQPATPQLKKHIGKDPNLNYNVWELRRLVLLPEYNGKNYGSYFVSRCLKLMPESYIVSYADSGWSHCGYVYQATNWIYTGLTEERVDKTNGIGKHAREGTKDSRYTQIRTAKYRYIYIVSKDKKSKKIMLNNLAFPIIKEYPKVAETKYNIDNPMPVDKRINEALDLTTNQTVSKKKEYNLFDL